VIVCERDESIPSPIHEHDAERATEFKGDSSSHHRNESLSSSSSSSSSSLSFTGNFKRYSLVSIHAEEVNPIVGETELSPVGLVDPSRPLSIIGPDCGGYCDSNSGEIDLPEQEFHQSHPPWRAFFTHPVAITLLVNGWVYVSSHKIIRCFHRVYCKDCYLHTYIHTQKYYAPSYIIHAAIYIQHIHTLF
jgi:hypothetical protein